MECQLKFSSKAGVASEPAAASRNDDAILLDTIDDSISVVIAKDKDCNVKFKKPISVKKGNLNELLLTFQSTSINDDIIVIKGMYFISLLIYFVNNVLFIGHRGKSSQCEIIDGENHSWIFFKSSNIEFNELYYYY